MHDWETVNGITGVISAVCAAISLLYMITSRKSEEIDSSETRIISIEKFMHFLLACSGWVLCCLSVLWFFEPFGSYPSRSEYKQFYGILLAFPAIVIFLTGLSPSRPRENCI